MENKRRISVYATNEDVKKMKMIAIQKGTTVTALLNEAIEDIINKN